MKVCEPLNSPAKWTQGKEARDAKGVSTNASDPTAVCWCLRGAINKCYVKRSDVKPPDYFEFNEVCDEVSSRIGDIVQWNDSKRRTFEEVCNLCLELNV